MAPQSFVLKIPDAAIADLNNRLSLTRFPDAAPGEPWAYGTSVDYVRDLISYWKDAFDWRVQEATLNDFPQFKVPLHDINLHYLHVPGVGPNPYVRFLLAQNLANVDFSDCLIDWVDHQMQPRFVAPLTLRGRQLVKAIHTKENALVNAGKRKAFAAFIECDPALFQIDRGRFRHRASEFTKLRTHFFHLLFQMGLVNRAHLLGIFCPKQPLCELEPSIHICFGKRYCLFVQLLCSRVSSSHTSVGLLTQFLGLSHVFRHSILCLVEGCLRHLAHLLGLLVDLITHCTLLALRLQFP
jgi:hypothetical protein